MKMTWDKIGLAAFVFMLFCCVAGLCLDLWLMETGHRTITAFCRRNPWAAWLILTLIQVGVMGLAMHFLKPVPVGD